MAVFRVERTGDYTVMSNFHLKDKRLSLKAKGLLSQMLSLPDDWDYTLSGLSYINRESKDAIRSAVNELETAGYIRRRQTTDASGKFAANEYTIFERPIEGEPMLDKPSSENPITVNPSAVNPLPENPTQLNTKKSNTQKQNTHGSNTDSIPFRETAAAIPPERKGRDAMSVTEIENYRELILENIEYDCLKQRYPLYLDDLNEIVELLVETVCAKRKTTRISGADFPHEIVRSRFLKLDSSHIEFVMDCLQKNTTQVRNIKQYLLAVLFNAPTGYACDSRTADAEFLLAKRQYLAATGRVRGADDVIAYHVRQSFRPGEITPEEANLLGVEFAKRFTKGNHAFVVCTHIDKSHIHNHIIWSSVSLEYDRKFRNFWGSTKAVRRLSDTICIENGLSIVENPKPHGKSYNKWLGDQAKPSHRELLRVAIDNALSQSPTDFEALLKLLQESGCEVSKRGKSYRLKLPGWEKAARMDSLGEGYGLEDLQAVLSGKKTHTPRKKTVTQAEPPKVNLLVDIQAKLQAGKGAGYARWAKVFNLKQMAQTMNYLSENNLLEYAVLEEKAAAATAHHNELSAQIKAAEKRMAEIAVLRTHIVNYAKTREVYVAYRKAGYSKKFREEHEEEILLHQAAKNAFDEMGVKKLPKVKELQTEYAKLLEEKKKTYAEYRRSREEMRELLTAKANVDRVLKMEVEQDVEKEKDHGQR